jgi:predicted RNase H-like nuclease (RuvC/YqgF family)
MTEGTTNVDLYNLRSRLAKNREQLKNDSSRYLEVQSCMDDVVQQFSEHKTTATDKMQQLEDRLSQLESKKILTFEDVDQKLNEFCSVSLLPTIQELCDDLENAITEFKSTKQKVDALTKVRQIEEDSMSLASQDIKPASRSLSAKPLQLQKKTRF